ncbi:MAG: peptidylprolyl isomerase PrsA [Lentilactobacillus hilgardii]|jgi:foldase protein PrsA|uniref:Foldase protein PrsA n=1 Tax=Lentilactobacillus hilgardii TaxID=1588 RepID=A0A6P1E918_LENHI|nr:peptidylprolyl isomerase PrsA [Lentilactobacillus hilgardii]MCI1923227.1 peptidylprolyl isomerase [Lentilactobacillus buchneri]RRG11911.1 MAG: peptidylprolyl isomerase [Lactobacillus sp.]EEI70268.1 PPIC-type PPIASE domain protein [Lentilactobacillus hilgardii ATCC 27305]MBZ2201126.1 peptidylprolyl isomerase [Lentilactobacillus hilgardii]MBZ2203623.1 peptidylprolyl isomerase [Lentilactobacillus hilgardii]
MKKWLIVLAGVLMSFTLAACGSKSVATTNGGKITESAYYSSLKGTSSGKQVLQQMILNKVLEKQYGKKVKDSAVNKDFNKYKKQYGSSFNAVLQQNGMTASQLKDSIRSNLLLQQAVRDNTKFTDAQLKAQFKSYQPKVTVNQILVSKKSTAETVIKQLKAGKSFSSLAKKYSTDTATKNKGGRISAFDNTNTSLDSNFKKAAFKLKNGDYTKTPVKTQYGYQVIQMVNHPAKGTYKDHESELKTQLVDKRLADSDTLHSVVSKVLKKGKVTIQDKDLQNVLSDYLSSSSKKK